MAKIKSSEQAPKPGDSVRLETSEKPIEGTLMQSPEKGIVIVKLDNGYNVGVEEGRIKKVEILFLASLSPKTANNRLGIIINN